MILQYYLLFSQTLQTIPLNGDASHSESRSEPLTLDVVRQLQKQLNDLEWQLVQKPPEIHSQTTGEESKPKPVHKETQIQNSHREVEIPNSHREAQIPNNISSNTSKSNDISENVLESNVPNLFARETRRFKRQRDKSSEKQEKISQSMDNTQVESMRKESQENRNIDESEESASGQENNACYQKLKHHEEENPDAQFRGQSSCGHVQAASVREKPEKLSQVRQSVR